jgi:hypothetical protein
MAAMVNTTPDLRRLARSLAQMIFKLTHNGFALVGVAVVCIATTLIARPDLREIGEAQIIQWVQERLMVKRPADADSPVIERVTDTTDTTETTTIERATATDPKDLPREQAAVAYWLSRKYRVAPEPISALVAAAYEVGRSAKLDPTLILAVMAVESSFNPFAQSPVGAQGIMQVMTHVHADKYQNFGGTLAAFDPVTNLRVGVKVLQECIARAGSVQGGLKLYVGAGNDDNDNGYADKVLSERARLQQVSKGRVVPTAPPQAIAATNSRPNAEPAASASDMDESHVGLDG